LSAVPKQDSEEELHEIVAAFIAEDDNNTIEMSNVGVTCTNNLFKS
jgi:hypothetical protein